MVSLVLYLSYCILICFGEEQSNVNPLSPQEMGALISSQNEENFPLVQCSINKYMIIIQTRPDWAPLGQKRFIELVNDRYYDGCALFRAINNFIVQFGLASTKTMRDKWGKRELEIQDDPHVDVKFERGIMSFAGGGANTRGTQIFFTLAKISTHLGRAKWEVPFGKVIYGDDGLKSINTEYGDHVSQGKIWEEGYEYLKREFPNLSYIDYCRVITEDEIKYYKKQQQQQSNDNKQELNVNEGNENVKDDLQQQLSEGGDNNEIMIFILEMSASAICIGILIFAVVKVLRKTPDKNN